MARIRTIKPTFFQSEDIAALTLRERLTFIGLWTYVDDAGRSKASPRVLKGVIWSLDDGVGATEVAQDLDSLDRHGRITRYVVDGTEYLEVTNFLKHQRINRPTVSTIPPPPLSTATPGASSDRSVSRHGADMEGSPRETEKLEVGREAVPQPWCERHPGGTESPCGACGRARRDFEAATTTPPPATPRPPRAHETDDCGHGLPTWDRRSCRDCNPQEVAA